MPIRLPSQPKDRDYEDFVASCALSLGYFVETNLTLKHESVEVAELDIVATPITNPHQGVVLLEAKSGTSGFSDIFKVSGLKAFLDLPKGCVVRPAAPTENKRAAIDRIAKQTGVTVTAVYPTSDGCIDDLIPPMIEVPEKQRDAFIQAAWYGRIARRIAHRKFLDHCKANDCPATSDARTYMSAMEQSFFEKRPINRANRLYEAYQRTPKVTGRLIDELTDDQSQRRAEWDKIEDTPERPALQRALMMENSARIRIIKNALLHMRGEQPHGASKKFSWQEALMPDSFKEGLEELRDHKYADRIPYLFQIFTEVFGGFYALHHDRDSKALACYTGIPAEDIPDALSLFDRFFPIPNGWFTKPRGELRKMKMLPAIMHGTGAFLRYHMFGKEVSYHDLYPSMGWLIGKWHDALYEFLEPHLKAD